MALYAISNPTSKNLRLRAGPNILFGGTGLLPPGRKGVGDFIYTYKADLVTDGSLRAQTGDQWIHVLEMDGAAVDGWMAIRHLGRNYAAIVQLPEPPILPTLVIQGEGYETVELKPKS
jgi:hypothetical protein